MDNLKDILTVEELRQFLRIGRNTVYTMLKTGTIKSIRHGTKYIIPKIYLMDYINKYR